MCGANNWRMPTPQELQSIVHYGRVDAAFEPTYFVNTPITGNGTMFWTGGNYSSNPAFAWAVGFDYGSVNGSFKGNFSRVRLVRAGQ